MPEVEVISEAPAVPAKPRMGRPPKDEDIKLATILVSYVTEQERKRFGDLAAAAEKTVSAWVRQTLLTAIAEKPEPEKVEAN